MVEAKLLRKKLKNGLIVDKWDLVTIIEKQQAEIDRAVELYTDKAIKVEQLEKELTEAGGMIGVLREYISDLENGLDSSIKLNKAQALRKAQEK